jgi:hypothetical protein
MAHQGPGQRPLAGAGYRVCRFKKTMDPNGLEVLTPSYATARRERQSRLVDLAEATGTREAAVMGEALATIGVTIQPSGLVIRHSTEIVPEQS